MPGRRGDTLRCRCCLTPFQVGPDRPPYCPPCSTAVDRFVATRRAHALARAEAIRAEAG